MKSDRSSWPLSRLEEHFRMIVELMYDTGISLPVLEEKVCPYFAKDIVFADPCLTSQGYSQIRTGMRGFHCAFRFEFDIHQLDVQMHADGRGGRALIEGFMNLRSIPGYMYPLRTILVYDFICDHDGRPTITKLEEMWSFGDMIANAPLGIGRLYQAIFRPLSGYFFLGFFWLACKLRNGQARPSRPTIQGEIHS